MKFVPSTLAYCVFKNVPTTLATLYERKFWISLFNNNMNKSRENLVSERSDSFLHVTTPPYLASIQSHLFYSPRNIGYLYATQNLFRISRKDGIRKSRASVFQQEPDFFAREYLSKIILFALHPFYHYVVLCIF